MMNEHGSSHPPDGQHPLERRVLAALREHGLARAGERGLVAVSGGPDSMALLHLLHGLRERLDLRLEVVHFDHGLRPESGREAEWVAARAGSLELPAHIVRTDHLAALGSGVQAAARAWRRQEARRLQTQWEAQWVATGHQRDDGLETWLLKWLRGAHLTSLQGIAWREGDFIRPLLGCTRVELTAYLDQQGVEWLEDPSNRNPRYKRNRVRHELLPLLEDLSGGGIAERLEDLDAQSRALTGWLAEALAAHSVPGSDPTATRHWISAGGLAGLPPFLAEAALYRFVTDRTPGHLPFRRVREALALLAQGGDGWNLDWPGGRRLRRQGERVLLEAATAPDASPGDSGEASWNDISTRVGAHEIGHPPRFRLREGGPGSDEGMILDGIDPDSPLRVRTRRPGDRFHPAWSSAPVKLKDFLRDRGIPRWERDLVPLLLLGEVIVAVYPAYIAGSHQGHQDGTPAGGGSDEAHGSEKTSTGQEYLNRRLHLVIEEADGE